MSRVPEVSEALSPDQAIERVAAGGLVGFPTETAWGLGVNAFDEAAVDALRACKGREAARPISVLVADLAGAERLGAELQRGARALAEAFWPGPLTLVVPCHAPLAPGVAGPNGVGLRCSPHPTARALAHLAAERGLGPLTATSLNRSGDPSVRTRAEAQGLCAALGAALVAGPDAGGEAESTVIDATGSDPKLLREGAIELAAITQVLERVSPR